MARFEINGNISSLLSFYKYERNIFGRCPHCCEPFRLSEVKLTYGKEPPPDLLGRLKRDRDRLRDQLDQLEMQIEEIEDNHRSQLDAVDTKWSDKVDNEVERRMLKNIKEIRRKAIAQSRAGQLGKTLEKIAPMFAGFGHHPSDVRPIFDPIDFVVFDGYYHGKVTDVVFVEFKTGESRLNAIQNSIRAAIEGKRVRFEERRIRKETLKQLTEGRERPVRKLIEKIAE